MKKILVLTLVAFGSLMLTFNAHAAQARPTIGSSQTASSSTTLPSPASPQRPVTTLQAYAQTKCAADYYRQRPKDTYKNFMASCTEKFVTRLGGGATTLKKQTRQ